MELSGLDKSFKAIQLWSRPQPVLAAPISDPWGEAAPWPAGPDQWPARQIDGLIA